MRRSRKTDHAPGLPRIALGALVALTVAACGGDAPESEVVEELEGPDDPYSDQTAYGFDDLDMDGDSTLDESEFHGWAEGPQFAYYYGRLVVEDATDPQDIGALDAEVLFDALYQAWDRNDDGELDADEWGPAARVIETLSDTTASWVEFDIDGNERLDFAEVYTRIDADPALAAMDMNQDGEIVEQEFNRWFFEIFDVDGDVAIDREEWRLAELYLNVPTL